jgi:hypothetical protein
MYNFRTDETKITLSQEFKESDWILKLDILRDAIYDLEEIYNETCAKEIAKDKGEK